MADIRILALFILSWEGGFVNDPLERGGATNMGVTIGTWRQVGYDKDGDGDIDVDDLQQLSTEDVVERVLRPHYWNRWKADDIIDQSVANICVDWVWVTDMYTTMEETSIFWIRSIATNTSWGNRENGNRGSTSRGISPYRC